MIKKIGRPKGSKNPPKQFCVHGHDTFVCKRNKGGHCNLCNRKNQYEYKVGNQEKIKQFYKDNKDKYIARAKKRYVIKKDEILEYQKVYYQNNKQNILEYSKQYRIEHIDSINRYIQDHIEQIKKRCYDYEKTHKKERKKYRLAHPEIYKLAKLKNHKKRSLRVVKFGQEGILEFYKNCPIYKEIDHIIPLCGKKVSGLHVLSNLQYLSKVDNNTKNNKVDLKKVSNQYGLLLQQLGLK